MPRQKKGSNSQWEPMRSVTSTPLPNGSRTPCTPTTQRPQRVRSTPVRYGQTGDSHTSQSRDFSILDFGDDRQDDALSDIHESDEDQDKSDHHDTDDAMSGSDASDDDERVTLAALQRRAQQDPDVTDDSDGSDSEDPEFVLDGINLDGLSSDDLQGLWQERVESQDSEKKRFIHRNDVPDRPSEYKVRTEFGDGMMSWRTKPFPQRDIDSWRKQCDVDDFPTISQKAADLNLVGEMDGFKYLQAIITPDVIEKVLEYTNKYAESEYSKKEGRTKWRKVDAIELWAYFGVLYYMGVSGLAKRSLTDLFSQNGKEAHLPLLLTFSRDRFLEITRYLRFHDKDGKQRKSNENKRQKIQEFIDPIFQNCVDLVIPSKTLVVDESLLSFKGRVAFLQYLPNKPDKYGIKYFVICDATTGAILGAKAYVGKEGGQKAVNLNTKIVTELAQPFAGSHRCVVADRYYSSPFLASELHEMGLDFVGTVQPNRKGLPKEFCALDLHALYPELLSTAPKSKAKTKSKSNGTADIDLVKETIQGVITQPKSGPKSAFLFSERLTLVKYEKKEKKKVFLISSLHHHPTVSDDKGKKPEMIHFYNSKKFGVDLMDQLVKNFTTKRTSRRWPMRILYWVLDVAAVQAYVLIRLCNPLISGDRNYRRTFMEDLADSLMREHQSRRRSLKSAHMRNVLRMEYALRCFVKNPRRNYSMSQSELKKRFDPAASASVPGKKNAVVRRNLFFGGSTEGKKDGRTKCLVNIAQAGADKKRSCGKKTSIACSVCNLKCCPDHRQMAEGQESAFICVRCA